MLTYIVSLLLSISEQHFIFVTIGQGVDTIYYPWAARLFPVWGFTNKTAMSIQM